MLLSAVYSYKNRLKFSVLTLQAAASTMKCNDECSWHGHRVWTSDVTSVRLSHLDQRGHDVLAAIK